MEVSNNGSSAEHAGTIQRLIESNKVWLACFLGVVALAMIFIKTSNQGGPAAPKLAPAPASFSVHDNEYRYEDFGKQLANDEPLRSLLVGARFLSPGRLRLVVDGTVSADDIEYAAKMAAEKVKCEFAHRVVVTVYMQNAKDHTERLVATASWREDTYGFVVKRHGDQAGML